MHDRSCFAAVCNDGRLGMRTLPLAVRATILTFIERVGRLRADLPGRTLRNLNRLAPFFHKGTNPQLNKRLNLCLMTGRIHAQRLVLDLWEEQWIIPCPFRACRACARLRQQIRIICIEGHIFQVEVNFAFDPLAKLSYCQRLCLAVLQNGTRAAVARKTLNECPFLVLRLLCCRLHNNHYVPASIMWHSAREPAQEENRIATECHITLLITGLGETPSVLCPDAMVSQVCRVSLRRGPRLGLSFPDQSRHRRWSCSMKCGLVTHGWY